MAISRLSQNNENFDIAIVSNIALELLLKNKMIVKDAFKDAKRQYLPMFEDISDHCLPFFWLISGYLYDPSNIREPIKQFSDFLNLKDRVPGIHLGVIDDLTEVVLRLKADHSEKIDILSSYPKKRWTGMIYEVDIPRYFPHQNLAFFTWHGIAKDHLIANQALEFSLPKHRPLIGYDAVCIMKNHKSDRKKLVDIVLEMTNLTNTNKNIVYNQYFSPYIEPQDKNLHPKVKKIYHEGLKSLRDRNYQITYPLSIEEIKTANHWWRSHRYGG